MLLLGCFMCLPDSCTEVGIFLGVYDMGVLSGAITVLLFEDL
jgi:hypothetical protein